jgi:hypothetical protein
LTGADLLNKGLILNRPSAEPGRTFIVTGLQRSGTSLVADLLRRAGLFIGSQINDAVLEDEEIAGALDTRNLEALQQIIARRNANHAVWGFKFPTLCDALGPGDLALFDRPRVIITFRDPVSIAVRTSLSEYQEPMRALRDVAINQAAMMAFAEALTCPSLLLSYEKALMFPDDAIDAVLRFCAIPRTAELHARLRAVIEPNSQRYIAVARRRHEGLIEGVRSGQLYGWCRLTQSNDPLTLDVFVDARPVMRLVADAFRQDLLDAGLGHGRHGFFIDLASLPARPDSVIRVAVAGFGVELENSGTRLGDFASAA